MKAEHLSFTVWDQEICMYKEVDYENYNKETNEITIDIDKLQEIFKDFAKKVSDNAIKAYREK